MAARVWRTTAYGRHPMFMTRLYFAGRRVAWSQPRSLRKVLSAPALNTQELQKVYETIWLRAAAAGSQSSLRRR
jgi:hypothetical protein